MFKFLHIRSRVLQILVFSFIGLTFYAYYRTNVVDNHPYIEFINAHYSQANYSLYKNVTMDTLVARKNTTTNFNTLRNNSQQSTDLVSFSTSILPQSPSSASIPVNSINSQSSNNNNFTTISRQLSSTNLNVTMPAMANDSVGAIYTVGHDIAVAEKCPRYGQDINLVIVIMSAPSHQDARIAIRQTWGHFGQRADTSIVFIIGKTKDSTIEKHLNDEENLYNDIIRGRFYDSYSNLTLKTISTLEWFSTYCSEAKFLLKTDDDMFINVPRLLAFITKHENDKNVIYGKVAKKWKPFRNKKSKYYVSPAQFKGKIFPDFATGPAYLLTRDVIDKLYDASMNFTFMTLEDVFITGVVAQKLSVKRVYVADFVNKRIPFNPCNIQREISIHMVKYSEQFDLWKKLLDGKSKCK